MENQNSTPMSQIFLLLISHLSNYIKERSVRAGKRENANIISYNIEKILININKTLSNTSETQIGRTCFQTKTIHANKVLPTTENVQKSLSL